MTRYDLSDFRDALGDEFITSAQHAAAPMMVSGEHLLLTPDAKPDFEKLSVLQSNVDKLTAYLNRDALKHPRMNDTSASGYDLAIANLCVRAGWSDQEIANLLIWNRVKHGDNLKLREDYYARTIAKARAGFDGTAKGAKEAKAAIEAARDEAIVTAGKLADPDERRQEVLLLLSAATGIGVVDIRSNGRNPATYRVLTAAGETFIVEGSGKLRSQETWFDIGLETNAKIPLDILSPKNWRTLALQLAQVVVFEKEEDSFEDLLDEYLMLAAETEGPDARNSRAGHLQSNSPILINGIPAIHLARFAHWLQEAGIKMDRAALRARIRALGFATRTLSFALGNAESSRTYWVAPEPRPRLGGPPRRGLRLVDQREPGGDDDSLGPEMDIARG